MDNLKGVDSEADSVIKVSKVIWELTNKIGDYGKFIFLLVRRSYSYEAADRRGLESL